MKNDDVSATAGRSPAARLCDLILSGSIERHASAVPLEPGAAVGRVSYELEGEWQRVMEIPARAYDVVIEQLDARAGLDAARPEEQRGAMRIEMAGQAYDAMVRSRHRAEGREATIAFRERDAGAGDA